MCLPLKQIQMFLLYVQQGMTDGKKGVCWSCGEPKNANSECKSPFHKTRKPS